MTSKPTEMPQIFLRQANKNEPAELVIGDGNSSSIYILRYSQLKQLAFDAVMMALKVDVVR
jgi:hypothetical protein